MQISRPGFRMGPVSNKGGTGWVEVTPGPVWKRGVGGMPSSAGLGIALQNKLASLIGAEDWRANGLWEPVWG